MGTMIVHDQPANSAPHIPSTLFAAARRAGEAADREVKRIMGDDETRCSPESIRRMAARYLSEGGELNEMIAAVLESAAHGVECTGATTWADHVARAELLEQWANEARLPELAR